MKFRSFFLTYITLSKKLHTQCVNDINMHRLVYTIVATPRAPQLQTTHSLFHLNTRSDYYFLDFGLSLSTYSPSCCFLFNSPPLRWRLFASSTHLQVAYLICTVPRGRLFGQYLISCGSYRVRIACLLPFLRYDVSTFGCVRNYTCNSSFKFK